MEELFRIQNDQHVIFHIILVVEFVKIIQQSICISFYE